jgi:hypothetical protein
VREGGFGEQIDVAVLLRFKVALAEARGTE